MIFQSNIETNRKFKIEMLKEIKSVDIEKYEFEKRDETTLETLPFLDFQDSNAGNRINGFFNTILLRKL